jgi:RNA polymerase sigma factor (sigma-70 family)
MMHIIQPHMETAWKNWKQTRSLKQEVDLLKNSTFQSEEEEATAARLRKNIETLTARQRDVVEWVAHGKDNQQIADELHISVGTVKKHLQLVFQSMEVQHRTELAAKWHQAHSVQLY